LSFAGRSIALRGSAKAVTSIRVWGGPSQLACTADITPAGATIATAVFRGRTKGIFAAVQRRSSSRIRGYVALPDLDANANYRLVGSERPCSKSDTGAARTFSLGLNVPRGGGLQVIEHLEDLTEPLRGIASVRLLSGRATQRACVKGSVVNVN
jgi:hypothetical protein